MEDVELSRKAARAIPFINWVSRKAKIEGQQAIVDAVANARSFNDLPDEYQKMLLEGERNYKDTLRRSVSRSRNPALPEAEESMVFAGYVSGTQLFYVVDPADPELDGVVIMDGAVSRVSFWDFVSRNPMMHRVRGCLFLNNLWGSEGRKDWAGKYVSRSVPFSTDELMSAEFLMKPVPN